MAKKFRVIPIAMQVQGNKMAEHGSIISEDQLLSPAATLIKDGWIEEVKEESKKEESKK